MVRAGWGEMTAVGKRYPYRTGSVISRLMALRCPYLQSMEETVVCRVVLTQGEARVRVLCWLLDRFQKDLPLNHKSTSVSMDAATLTSHLASIGLCDKENIALVEGKTSLLQQLLFLESLLDMVEAQESPSSSASQLEGSCRFVDSISASERLDSSVFTHTLNLLPADIGHQLDTRCPLLLWRCLWKPLARLSCPLPIWDMQEHHLLLLYWALEVYTSVNYWPVQNRSVSAEGLGSDAERLTALLLDRQAELHSILQQSQHQYEEVNSAVLQNCVKTLAVSLSTLTQLVTNFCQSYETELQPWLCHRQPPTLGPLGPLSKRAATHWNHVSKVLNSLQQLEATLQRLQSMSVPSMLSRNVAGNIYADPTCPKAQETLQQCVDLLTTD